MRLSAIGQDLRYGVRQLRLNPGVTAVAVLSLALGIGANTAIFQLVDAVRLRSLPVAKPQELALIDFPRGSFRAGWWSSRSAELSYAQWEQIQKLQQGFSGLAAWSAAQFNLSTGGEARLAEGLYVSGDFFRVLGVQPILGRAFRAEEDRVGCGGSGAVISYGFWQGEFGGDPQVLGRQVTLDGHPFPIIGVTGPGFFGVEVGSRYDVALPLCADLTPVSDGNTRFTLRHAWWLSAMGRLKPGWTVEKANAQLAAVSPAVMRATLIPWYPPENAKKYLSNKLEATPGATGVSGLRRQYETALWLLLGTTGLVMLIACANLANLLLARASVREREIAVRQAIGASRARLIAQLLAESLLLSIVGTVLGVLLAQGLSRGLIAFLGTKDSPVFVGLGMDLRMLGFTAALAAGTCLLFGLLPALRATAVAPAAAMRTGGRGMTAGRERFSLRRALVVTQVSLSLILLTGALLFVGSLQKLLTTDTGFRADGVISVDLDFNQAKYPKERVLPVRLDLLERLRTLPGVVSAAQVDFTPVGHGGWDQVVRPRDGRGARLDVNLDRAGPGYFRTMGIGLVAGREFDDHDTLTSPKVAIVNEEFAKRVLGGGNPLGRTFLLEFGVGTPDAAYQVVGLVRNTKYYEIREEFKPIAFFPVAQNDQQPPGATYVLRISGPPAAVFRGAKNAAEAVHPRIGIQFTVLREQLDNSLLRERLVAALAAAFGLLAGVLATLGLYGVIAYMVARRRNEIGVRMALGADRGRVVRLVLREAALLVIAGLIIGTGLAIWAGRAATTLLFGLKPWDPATLTAACALLATVALLASYGPARRASRLEPMTALRDE